MPSRPPRRRSRLKWVEGANAGSSSTDGPVAAADATAAGAAAVSSMEELPEEGAESDAVHNETDKTTEADSDAETTYDELPLITTIL